MPSDINLTKEQQDELFKLVKANLITHDDVDNAFKKARKAARKRAMREADKEAYKQLKKMAAKRKGESEPSMMLKPAQAYYKRQVRRKAKKAGEEPKRESFIGKGKAKLRKMGWAVHLHDAPAPAELHLSFT